MKNEHLDKYIKMIEDMLEDDFTSIEIAAALLKQNLNTEEETPQKIDFGDTGAEPGMVRLFVNIGRRDKISPRHIVGAIAGETGISGNLIGAIDVYDNFTFVEVPREDGHQVLEIMKNNTINGTKINIEPANKK